jgi:hypothetical protein
VLQGSFAAAPLRRRYRAASPPPLDTRAAAAAQGSSSGFVVGLAFWPGGTEADWGDPVNGVQPCNGTELQANLVRRMGRPPSANPHARRRLGRVRRARARKNS